MKKIFLLLFAGAALGAAAQQAKPPIVYKQAISFNPLALADFDHTLMFTGEYRVKENIALLADVGYIFASDYLNQIQKTSGINIRPAVRWYYGKRNKGYLQLQGFYKQANYTLQDWVGKDCVDDVPTYEEFTQFGYRKKVAGLNFIIGGVLPLSPSHKWLLDLYGGLGFRYKTHNLVDVTGCYETGQGWFSELYNDDITTLSVPVGVRLTYVLR